MRSSKEVEKGLSIRIHQLNAELEQVRRERDRYWEWIKSMGCATARAAGYGAGR